MDVPKKEENMTVEEPMLAQVMKSYLNISTPAGARKWVRKQPASEERKKLFIQRTAQVFDGNKLIFRGDGFKGEPVWIECLRHEEDCLDYIDSLRTLHISHGHETR